MKLLQISTLFVVLTASQVIECSKTAVRQKSVKFETATTMAHNEPTQPSLGEINARIQHPEPAPKNSQAPVHTTLPTIKLNAANMKVNAKYNPADFADLTTYSPGYRNEFMSVPEQSYTKQLQQKFPDASVQDLITYTNLFLKETGKQQRNSNATEIIQNPQLIGEFDVSITLQRLYNKLSNTSEHQIQQQQELQLIPDTPVDTSFNISIETPTPYLDKITSAAEQAIADPGTFILESADKTAQHLISGIYWAGDQVDYVGNVTTKAAGQAKDALVNSVHDAVNTGINIGAQQLIRIAKNALTAKPDPNAKSTFSEKTQNDFVDLLYTAKDQGIEKGTEFLTNQIASLSSKTEPIVTKPFDPAEFNQPMLTSKAVTQSHTSTLKTSTVTGYLSYGLRESAKAVRNSPQRLAGFIKNTVNAFARITRLSKENTSLLQVKSKKQVDLLIADKTSWFYAPDKEFDGKFNAWMKSMVTVFNKSLGKNNPTDIRIMQTESGNSDPSIPKITVNYNKHNATVTSGAIEYKGLSYNVDPADINSTNPEEIVITTSLYSKLPQNGDVFSSLVYNPTVKNSIRDVQQSQLGRAVEQKAPGLLGKIRNALTSDSGISDGKLIITVNKKSGAISTKVIKDGKAINTTPQEKAVDQKSQEQEPQELVSTGTITSTKSYDNNHVTQNITLDGPTSDIFAPTIKIQYDPNSINSGERPLITLAHTNRQTKQTSAITIHPEEMALNNETGTYTVTTTRLNEHQSQAKLADGLANRVLEHITDKALKQKLTKPLEQLEAHLSELPTQTFKDFMNNLDKSYVPAMLKNIAPEAYQQVIDFILEPIPTKIEQVTIEFNPRTNQVATRVIKTMSDDTYQPAEIFYSIS